MQQATHWVRPGNVCQDLFQGALLCAGQSIGQRVEKGFQFLAIYRHRDARLLAPFLPLPEHPDLQNKELVKGKAPACTDQAVCIIRKVDLVHGLFQRHQIISFPNRRRQMIWQALGPVIDGALHNAAQPTRLDAAGQWIDRYHAARMQELRLERFPRRARHDQAPQVLVDLAA